jgi:hypothetical protein
MDYLSLPTLGIILDDNSGEANGGILRASARIDFAYPSRYGLRDAIPGRFFPWLLCEQPKYSKDSTEPAIHREPSLGEEHKEAPFT